MQDRSLSYCLALLSFALWGTSGPAAAAEPQVFHLVYTASSSGMSATAERFLENRGDDVYLLANEMEVRVAGIRLGRAAERSEFLWQNDQPIPLRYSYRQSGISDRSESAEFDWTSGSVASSEDEESWSLPLTAGVADKLSYQLLLSQQLMHESPEELHFNVVDTDEIETHLYRISGREEIDTGIGRLNTVKVERVREAESPRRTTYWLAADWDMVLVKLLQVNGSGSETELLLETGQLAGQPITGLP